MPSKNTATKSAAKKKPVAKKAPAKKTASKRPSSKAVQVHHRPFMQAKFTEQTIYWLIIGIAVIALAAWVLSLQVQLNEMYDEIEATNTSYVAPEKTN